jgi:acetyl-CoA carboxylase carboxyltransferase component
VDTIALQAPTTGTVVHLGVDVGDTVVAGATVLALEVMKLEHPVVAPVAGRVVHLEVEVGQDVQVGQVLARLAVDAAPARSGPDTSEPVVGRDGEVVGQDGEVVEADGEVGDERRPLPERADLQRVLARRALLDDAARPEAVAGRRALGRRTTRENLAALVDEGSLDELGGLAIAAQRSRRELDELLHRTPADGLVTAIVTIGADVLRPGRARCAVLAYDATVLAGTQGAANHRKADRLLTLALEHDLPVVLLAEGGGGRPGDTDVYGASFLDVPTFRLLAQVALRQPVLAFVDGHCFAGNAALAGTADVLVATTGSNLGMAGPAMIEGAGLGAVDAAEIGPIDVHRASGAVDVVVDDDVAGVEVLRSAFVLLRGVRDHAVGEVADQSALRGAVPEERRRTYDVRALLRPLVDADSLLELRAGAARAVVTALGRLDGRAVGIVASDPSHLGGAIDAEAADSVAAHLRLCGKVGLPIVVLCDTPGFMVGPDAERDGGVRRFGALFAAGAALTVPLVAVIVRRAYGLGAMALLGGHLQAPVRTLAWPTAELGPMGLEGAVRLGYRRELEAIADPVARAAREEELVAEAYARADALHVATYAELDDVIDPATTRARVVAALAGALDR